MLISLLCALVCGLVYLTVVSAWFPRFASAKPLKKALVRKTINQVYYYPSIKKKTEPDPAVAGQTIIQGDDALRTGQNSRSELLFNDKSIARVGSNAVFSFVQGSRQLNLADGAMLLQVPKGSKTTTVRTAGATAGVTGTTVMMEHEPNSHVKMITLEGQMTVSLRGRAGASRTLSRGQMLLFPPDATRLPEPVTIDLERLTETSKLIQGFEDDEGGDEETKPTTKPGTKQEPETKDEGAVFNEAVINKAVEKQNKLKKQGTLEKTNMVIEGEGTEITLEEPEPTEVTDEITQTAEDQEIHEDAKETQVEDEGTIEPQAPDLQTISVGESFRIDGSVSFTLSEEDPTVTFNPTASGAFYDSTIDGIDAPSQFLFDGTRSIDETLNFNASSAPLGFIRFTDGGAASFRFSNFDLTGLPDIDRSENVSSLALVSVQSMTVEALPPLPNLFLGTQDGSVTVNLPAQSVPSGSDYYLYARGAGNSLDLTLPFDWSTLTGRLRTTGLSRTGDWIAVSEGPLTIMGNSGFATVGRSIHLTAGGPLSAGGPSTDGDLGAIISRGGDITLQSFLSSADEPGIDLQGSLVEHPITGTQRPSLTVLGLTPPNGTPGNITMRTDGSALRIDKTSVGVPSPFGTLRNPMVNPALSTMTGGNITLDAGNNRLVLTEQSRLFSGTGNINLSGGSVSLGGTGNSSTGPGSINSLGTFSVTSRGGKIDISNVSIRTDQSPFPPDSPSALDSAGDLTLDQTNIVSGHRLSMRAQSKGSFTNSSVFLRRGGTLTFGGDVSIHSSFINSNSGTMRLNADGDVRFDGGSFSSFTDRTRLSVGGTLEVLNSSFVSGSSMDRLTVGNHLTINNSSIFSFRSASGPMQVTVGKDLSQTNGILESTVQDLQLTVGGKVSMTDSRITSFDQTATVDVDGRYSMAGGLLFGWKGLDLQVGGDITIEASSTPDGGPAEVGSRRAVRIQADGSITVDQSRVTSDLRSLVMDAGGPLTVQNASEVAGKQFVDLRASGDLTLDGPDASDVLTLTASEGSIRGISQNGGIVVEDRTQMTAQAGEDSRIDLLTKGGDLRLAGRGGSLSDRVRGLTCNESASACTAQKAESDPSILDGGIVLDSVDPTDPSVGGNVTVQQSYLASEVLSVRGLGSQTVTIGPDATLRSQEMLRIYTPAGQSNGTIQLKDNTTLEGNGNPIQIAAPSVSIAPDATIDNVDPVTIWTDSPNSIDTDQFSNPSSVSVQPLPNPNSLETTSSPDPFTLDGSSRFDLGVTPPEEANSGEQGTMFRGAHLDGSPSDFLYDRDRSFDRMVGLDDPVSGLEPFADWDPLAVFRFSDLDVGDLNATALGSPGRSVGLLGESGLDIDPASVGSDNTKSIKTPGSIFFGTQDGSITVTAGPNEFFAETDRTDWMLYARGPSSDLTVTDGLVSVNPEDPGDPSAGILRGIAERDVKLNPGSKDYSVLARRIELEAGNQVQVLSPNTSGNQGKLETFGYGIALRSHAASGLGLDLRTNVQDPVGPHLSLVTRPNNDGEVGDLELITNGAAVKLTFAGLFSLPQGVTVSPNSSSNTLELVEFNGNPPFRSIHGVERFDPSDVGDAFAGGELSLASRGGPITVQDSVLYAPDNRLEARSSGGDVSITRSIVASEGNFEDFPLQLFTGGGQLTIQDSLVDSLGSNLRFDTLGGALTVDNSDLFSSNPAESENGPIDLLTGGGNLNIRNQSRVRTFGDDVNIETVGGDVEISGGSMVNTLLGDGSGDGGDITVKSGGGNVSITGSTLDATDNGIHAVEIATNGGPITVSDQSTLRGMGQRGDEESGFHDISLSSDGGNITVSGNSTVTGENLSLEFDSQDGRIRITEDSLLETGGDPLHLGGEFVQSGSIRVDGGSVLNTATPSGGNLLEIETEGAIELAGARLNTNGHQIRLLDARRVHITNSDLDNTGTDPGSGFTGVRFDVPGAVIVDGDEDHTVHAGKDGIDLDAGRLITTQPFESEGGPIELDTVSDLKLGHAEKDRPVRILTGEGSNVTMTSKHGSIRVKSSSQIQTLVETASSGGQITMHSKRGVVTLQGSGSSNGNRIEIENCESSRCNNLAGTIRVESGSTRSEPHQASMIQTENARLRANMLKMRAHGPEGDLIIGNNTTLSASNLMKLYAPGSSGTVRFMNDVVLNGGTAHIAGSTVEIIDNATVDNSGLSATNVYAGEHHYGQSGFGAFAESPKTQKSLSDRPAFDSSH